jgi:predicted RNA binding protein with dsRBD fold (UPF0201 family)
MKIIKGQSSGVRTILKRGSTNLRTKISPNKPNSMMSEISNVIGPTSILGSSSSNIMLDVMINIPNKAISGLLSVTNINRIVTSIRSTFKGDIHRNKTVNIKPNKQTNMI